MKIAIFAIASLIVISNANLIVDREIAVNQLAEGVPSTVKYTFYNTFGK